MRCHLFCVLKDPKFVVIRGHFKYREEHEVGILRHEPALLELTEVTEVDIYLVGASCRKGSHWILLSRGPEYTVLQRGHTNGQ